MSRTKWSKIKRGKIKECFTLIHCNLILIEKFILIKPKCQKSNLFLTQQTRICNFSVQPLRQIYLPHPFLTCLLNIYALPWSTYFITIHILVQCPSPSSLPDPRWPLPNLSFETHTSHSLTGFPSTWICIQHSSTWRVLKVQRLLIILFLASTASTALVFLKFSVFLFVFPFRYICSFWYDSFVCLPV